MYTYMYQNSNFYNLVHLKFDLLKIQNVYRHTGRQTEEQKENWRTSGEQISSLKLFVQLN